MMYALVIFGMLACSFSQILLKVSANKAHRGFFASMLNWRVVLAYLIFFGSMLINIIAMRQGLNLKELPVLEASSYIFVPILSMLFLQERLDMREIIAMATIVCGIITFYL